MHLLYVSGTYMPASGGAEISMFSLLECLVVSGIQVSVFTSTSVPWVSEFAEKVGIKVHHVEASSLSEALTEFCSGASVDLIATQNLWADRTILFAREKRIPSIYFARNAHGNLDLSRRGPYECNHIIANSAAVADFVATRWRRHPSIIRSIIRFADYLVEPGEREFCTMVNPIGHKGGSTFRSIVELMPQQKFLGVEGWAHLRLSSRWNVELFQDLSAGFGTDLWLPEEFDFSGVPNLIWKNATADMREVYAVTRVLLVPSVYAESVPRVAFEAMINGIPVIGSETGGIIEALSASGVLVKDFRNPAAWVAAIQDLEDASEYRRVAKLAKEYVSSLDYDAEVKRCISIFEQVIEDSRVGYTPEPAEL